MMYSSYISLNNQKGFSIPSVMIGISIMGIMSVGLSQMIMNSTNSVNYLEDKMEVQDFKRELSSTLSNPQACEFTLRGQQVLPEFNINQIREATNQIVHQVNQNIFPSSRVIIKRISVSNVNVPPAVGSSGDIKLLVNLSRRASSTETDLKPVEILISAKKFAADNRIETCVANGSAGSESDLEKACVMGSRILKDGSTRSARETDTEQCRVYGHIDRTYDRTYICTNGNITRTRNDLVNTRNRNCRQNERPE